MTAEITRKISWHWSKVLREVINSIITNLHS